MPRSRPQGYDNPPGAGMADPGPFMREGVGQTLSQYGGFTAGQTPGMYQPNSAPPVVSSPSGGFQSTALGNRAVQAAAAQDPFTGWTSGLGAGAAGGDPNWWNSEMSRQQTLAQMRQFIQPTPSMAALQNQRDMWQAMAGYNTGQAQQQYGLTNQGIQNDLWRQNAQWGAQQGYIGQQQGTAGERWGELQQNNAANVGFAGNERDIRNWLNSQNVAFNGRRLDLANQGTNLDWGRSRRLATTDATSRGARTSRGYAQGMAEYTTQRDIGLGNNQLGFDSQEANLNAERLNIGLDYNRTIESLRNQLANGSISYRDALNALNYQLTMGGIGNQAAQQNAGLAQQLAQFQMNGTIGRENLNLMNLLAGQQTAYPNPAVAAAQQLQSLWG